MSRFLIIPELTNIEEQLALAEKYNLGFEYNDYFSPKMLDDEAKLQHTIDEYKKYDLPNYCTCHGDFFDVLVFSEDRLIREIADKRIRQSIDTARKAGAKAVVFHTNYEPALTADTYIKNWTDCNEEYFSGILKENPDMNIYIENMFDRSPYMLKGLSERLAKYSNFGVCFDYAHAMSFGRSTDINDWVKALAPYIKHMHINDNDLENDLHLAIGDGKIDWNVFAKYYEKYFCKSTILIEVSGIEKQRRSVKFLESKGMLGL